MDGTKIGRYVNFRDGLPNVARNIGVRPLRIGYLGGSLTMMKDGWRPLLHEWFNETWPHGSKTLPIARRLNRLNSWCNQTHPRSSKGFPISRAINQFHDWFCRAIPHPHHQLNAARGGVGSTTGAFLVQEEICEKRPDLVFVEYAINDAFTFLTPPALLVPAIEGIIRNVKSSRPECDICFVYMLDAHRQHDVAKVTAAYERVASHYGIPSINVTEYLSDLVSGAQWSFDGSLGLARLLRDECHPLPVGNQIIVELLSNGVRNLLDHSSSQPKRLPSPISQTPMSGGQIMPVAETMVSGPYRVERRRVGNISGPVRWFSLPVGSCLEFETDGVIAGLSVIVGPRSGIVRATIGDRVIERQLFDRWSHYDRISTLMLSESEVDLRTTGTRIRVELTELVPDRSVCARTVPESFARTLDVVALLRL